MFQVKNDPEFYACSENDKPKAHLATHPDGSMVALATERGAMYRKLNKDNEDGVATGTIRLGKEEIMIADMVVDGVGGHKRGRRAAQLILMTFHQLCKNPPQCLRGHIKPPLAFVQLLVQESYKKFQKERLGKGRLSTIVLSIRFGDEIVVAHLGDSKALLFESDGTFESQTADHLKTRYWTKVGKLSELTIEVPVKKVYGDMEFSSYSLRRDFPGGLIMVLASDGVTNNTLSKVRKGRGVVRESYPVLSGIIQRHRSDVLRICNVIMDFSRERMKDCIPHLGSENGANPDNSSCIVHHYS